MSSKWKPYIRKTLYVLSIVLLIVLLTFLHRDMSNQQCSEIIIKIKAPAEKQLITERLVMDKISNWYNGGLMGVSRDKLNLVGIEKRLESLPAIENAEVSFDLRGVLRLDILQRVPVVRIITGSSPSYYLASDFTNIPAAGTEVARVPIANGRLTNAMIKKVYTLSTYVQENEFMEALTEQIFVDNNGDLVIIPKIKNQRIIMGDTMEIEDKFSKLHDFYTEGLNHIGWNTYHIINLKYKDQIVCK